MSRIKMNKFGSTLNTHSSGKIAFTEIKEILSTDESKLVFDFEEVDCVTNFFVDETFGRLIEDMGLDRLKERTTFENLKPFCRNVIATRLSSRPRKR